MFDLNELLVIICFNMFVCIHKQGGRIITYRITMNDRIYHQDQNGKMTKSQKPKVPKNQEVHLRLPSIV